MFGKRKIWQLAVMWTCINVLLLSNLNAQQNLVVANSANIFDHNSSFINPAILHFQPSRLVFGMKVFHVGFMEDEKFGFRNNYFCISSPHLLSNNFVVGFTGQYFGLPIYKQSQFSFSASYELRNQFAIGLKYNILNHAYDRSQFDQIDSWDPVFSNGTTKISHSFGLGILFFPISDLSVGFSCDHLNRPDISLVSDGIRQPFLFDFGIRYTYKLLSTSINMNLYQNSPTFSWMLESVFPDKGLVRAGYEMNGLRLEGQMYVAKGISINYGYDYPLYDFNDISSGSHQVSLIYDFEYNRNKISRIDDDFDNEKRDLFVVSISNEQLKIINKKFKRSFSEEITNNKIQNLTNAEIGELDLTENDTNFLNPDYRNSISLKEIVINTKLTDNYKKYLQILSDQLQSDKKKNIVVFHNNKKKNNRIDRHFSPAATKQIVVKSLITDTTLHTAIPIKGYEEEKTLYFPEKVYFDIWGNNHRKSREWKLEIKNYWGQVVRVFNGTGDIPSQIEWNWKDEDKNLLQPGDYFYTFYMDGFHQQTKNKSFKVIKVIRHLDVEITTQLKSKVINSTTYKIKLNN